MNEIEAKKKISLQRFIYSLGILHIGEETANLLARKLQASGVKRQVSGVISDLIEKGRRFTLEELQEIQDIGP